MKGWRGLEVSGSYHGVGQTRGAGGIRTAAGSGNV